ncbi:hypothetical protein Acr_04g0000380 [Actinidia rufa]|uniref:Uncharacterized protein n=1 Tax=Actinidia rufa TaxID=165716 RepID=A0A7J0EFY2_9ERIC|nr:hypothetical protein Acr_04g0000380 [Actinidia rufa]
MLCLVHFVYLGLISTPEGFEAASPRPVMFAHLAQVRKPREGEDHLAEILEQCATELEKQVVELGIREQQAADELEKLKGEYDTIVEGLKKEEEVEKATSKYFGEGFDLCKKQVRRLHPKLNIEDLEIDDELANKGKEEDGEEEKENEEKGNTSPISP